MDLIEIYINEAPVKTQATLRHFHQLIKEVVPSSEEKLTWGMPTYKHYGNLVHFALNKNHIGFYPGPSAIVEFEQELKAYKCSKGTVRFPLDKDLPAELIQRMVSFRVKENEEWALKK